MRRLVIMLSASTILFSCSGTKQKDVGRFVYVDYLNVIHIDKECITTLIKNPKTEDERMINLYGVEFIDTCKLEHGQGNVRSYRKFELCSKCVDDKVYQHLNAIMDRNELITDSRKMLYRKFRSANYSIGTYDDFIKNLGNREKRKRAYDAALSEEWDIGSFDEFSNELGFD